MYVFMLLFFIKLVCVFVYFSFNISVSVEVAGKAWRSVAKKDESLDHGRQKTQRGEGRAGGGGASGATNAFRETRLVSTGFY